MTSEEAWLANATYLTPNERKVALTNKGYNVDTNDDEYYAAVKDGKVYHGHRGTSNSDDFWTDVRLAEGSLHDSDRYKRSDLKAREMTRKYSNHQHVHLGHSLGGTLADHISRQYENHQSVAFNLGTSPFQRQEAFSSQHQSHRVDDDLVSSFTGNQSTTSKNKQSKITKFAKQSIYTLSPLASLYGAYEALQAHKLDNFN